MTDMSPERIRKCSDHQRATDAKPESYITGITSYGCNLLGLSSFFSLIGALFSSMYVAEHWSLTVGRILVLSSVVMMAMVDLLWRRRYAAEGRIMRFLWPSTGGCLVFLPVWAIYAFGILGALIYSLALR
jgi:hypothetical protein